MKKIKLPGTVTLLFGSLGAFWIASFVNPGFSPVGVLILLLIPVVIVEYIYPQHELEQLLEELNSVSYRAADSKTKKTVSGELINDNTAIDDEQ